jgi:hypothetical protein
MIFGTKHKHPLRQCVLRWVEEKAHGAWSRLYNERREHEEVP